MWEVSALIVESLPAHELIAVHNFVARDRDCSALAAVFLREYLKVV